jgi:hypothetical protein
MAPRWSSARYRPFVRRRSGVDVELWHDDLALGSWSLPRWSEPADAYEIEGTRYLTTGFVGPVVQRNGRMLYQVFARRER